MTRQDLFGRDFVDVYSREDISDLTPGDTIVVKGLGRVVYGGEKDGRVNLLSEEFAPYAVLVDSVEREGLKANGDGTLGFKKGYVVHQSRVTGMQSGHLELRSILHRERAVAA